MGLDPKTIAHLPCDERDRQNIARLKQLPPRSFLKKPKRPKRERPAALAMSSSIQSIEVLIPIRSVNPLNSRQHWRVVNGRGATEKLVTRAALSNKAPLPALPVVIEMTRLGKGNRAMDIDGCWASLKHCKDSIADAYGIDDADPRIDFVKPQQKTRQPEYGVSVVIRTIKSET